MQNLLEVNTQRQLRNDTRSSSSSSHHHQLRRPPLSHQSLPISWSQATIGCSHTTWSTRRTYARSTHARLSTHRLQRVPLAVDLARDLKVIIRKHHPALHASKAARMILAVTAAIHSARAGLEILALDAAIAASAERAVVLVVVLLSLIHI